MAEAQEDTVPEMVAPTVTQEIQATVVNPAKQRRRTSYFNGLAKWHENKGHSKSMAKVFNKYDAGNETFTRDTVAQIVDDMNTEKKRGKMLQKVALAMCAVVTLIVFANAGLTAAIVFLSKEVSVKDGRLVDPDTNALLRVGSADTKVGSDGTMRDQSSNQVIKTASVLQSLSIDSRLPDDVWDELKYIDVRNENGGSVHLFVQAFTRIPCPTALYGSYVQVHSTIGTITLDGDIMTFSDALSTKVFTEAKFTVSNSGRRLAGIIYLLGFFNQIPSFDGWNATYDTPPVVPSVFYANATLMYSCAYEGGNLCDDAGVGSESRQVFLGKLWTVSKLDMWADLNAGIGKEVYWYMAGNPGWTFEKHLDMNAKLEHIKQTWRASGESYFCRTTPQPAYMSSWLSPQSAATAKAAYKGEVDLEGDMVHYIQIKPREAEHVSLDFYFKFVDGDMLPEMVQMRIGQDIPCGSADDGNARLIAYKFDSFQPLASLPPEAAIFDLAASPDTFNASQCAETYAYTDQGREGVKIHRDNMIHSTDPLTSPLARTALRYVLSSRPTQKAWEIVAWEENLVTNHTASLQYRMYLDADDLMQNQEDHDDNFNAGTEARRKLAVVDRLALVRFASELTPDTDQEAFSDFLNRLDFDLSRGIVPGVQDDYMQHHMRKLREANVDFHGRSLGHCGRQQRELEWTDWNPAEMDWRDPAEMDWNQTEFVDRESYQHRRSLCHTCGRTRQLEQLPEHKRRLCHGCACSSGSCVNAASKRCSSTYEVSSSGFPFNFMKAREDYDRGKKGEKALMPCDVSMGYPIPCKGSVTCGIDEIPLCCGGLVKGSVSGSGSWDCADDFSSCEATIGITGTIGCGIPKCSWCPNVLEFSVTYARTMGIQACCSGPFAYTKDTISLGGTFAAVVNAELKGEFYEMATADDNACRTARPNYIENQLRQMVVSGKVEICFIFCFSIISGNVFMQPGSAKPANNLKKGGDCCDWVDEWASRDSCGYCPNGNKYKNIPFWTFWDGDIPGCWSSRQCS